MTYNNLIGELLVKIQKIMKLSFIVTIMFIYFTFNLEASIAEKTIDIELSKYDFLKKYSYPIFLTKNGKVGNGTCFFYRSNGKIYVVSNAHTFTGWNPLKREIEYDFDSIQIKYPTRNNSGTGTIKMLWGRRLIKRFKMTSFVNQIDLLGVPLDKLDPNGKFHFINELIDPAFLIKRLFGLFRLVIRVFYSDLIPI